MLAAWLDLTRNRESAFWVWRLGAWGWFRARRGQTKGLQACKRGSASGGPASSTEVANRMYPGILGFCKRRVLSKLKDVGLSFSIAVSAADSSRKIHENSEMAWRTQEHIRSAFKIWVRFNTTEEVHSMAADIIWSFLMIVVGLGSREYVRGLDVKVS